jgi:DNA-binding response OmpR family regulator
MNEIVIPSMPDDLVPLAEPAKLPLPTGVKQDSFDESIRTAVQEKIAALNPYLQRLQNSRDDEARVSECSQLQKLVRSLKKTAADSGMRVVERQAVALGSLVSQISVTPSNLCGSHLRTLSLAVNVLATLMRAPDPRQDPLRDAVAVIVDAEHLSCSAASGALRQAGLQPRCFSDPVTALDYLSSNLVDLVLLDTSTATRGGTDLYAKLRDLSIHRHTPVICITNSNETKRAAEMLTNETQFLAKPHNMISYLELVLKALSRVLSSRVGNRPVTTIPLNLGSPKTSVATAPAEQSQGKDDLPANPTAPESPSSCNSAGYDSISIQPQHQCPETNPVPESEAVATLQKRNQDLQAELAQVWKMCEEVNREFGAEKAANDSRRKQEEAAKRQQEDEPEASRPGDSSKVDRRLRESVASYARLTAELEKERGERRRLEQRAASMASQLQELHGQFKDQFESESQNQKRVTDLEQQLRERDESLARARADLQKETEERQLAEQQLGVSSNLSAQLRNCIASFETAKQAFKRRQEELDVRLQAFLKTSHENEARVQKETADRRRAEESLLSLQEQSQKDALEISKLQSALEVEQAERQRLEGDAIQARYATLDSARASLVLANKIRRQVRDPIDDLMQLTRHLLDCQLEEEPKKLVESLIENALLLQANLQDLSNGDGVPDGSVTDPQNHPDEGAIVAESSAKTSANENSGRDLAAA